jgi:RNA-directed DNA polymerase
MSNIYLHYVPDLWFERVVKPLLEGEAYMVRSIDDFVLFFHYQSDALRVQAVLSKRLDKFGRALAPSKAKLVEFGRFAQTHAGKRGRKRPETIYFLGFTLYCTRNRKGNFKVGFRTEKTRLHRSLYNLCDLMRRTRHLPVKEQAINFNRVLRGHYAYYGVAGNFCCLQRLHRAVERYWYKMLCSRSRKGSFPGAIFHWIKKSFPLLRPRLVLPYGKLKAIAML